MVGIQEMIMAADPLGNGKIYLLPAWPQDWEVDCKLHAPQQTVVKLIVRRGKLAELKVYPNSRERDVILDSKFKH